MGTLAVILMIALIVLAILTLAAGYVILVIRTLGPIMSAAHAQIRNRG